MSNLQSACSLLCVRPRVADPSGLPLARAPGVEPVALRLSPKLRTPPLPAAHVRGGDRPSSTDLGLPLNSHPSISNPVVHSMRATSRRTANLRAATGAEGLSCFRDSAGLHGARAGDRKRGEAQAGAAPRERSPSASSRAAGQLTPSRSALAAWAAKGEVVGRLLLVRSVSGAASEMPARSGIESFRQVDRVSAACSS